VTGTAVNLNIVSTAGTDSGFTNIASTNTVAVIPVGQTAAGWISLKSATIPIPAANSLPEGALTRFGLIMSINGVMQLTGAGDSSTTLPGAQVSIGMCASTAPACDPTAGPYPFRTIVTSQSGVFAQNLAFGMTEMIKDITPNVTPTVSDNVTVNVYVKPSTNSVWALTSSPTFQLNSFLIQTASKVDNS